MPELPSTSSTEAPATQSYEEFLEDEMEGLRRVEQQVAEFAARRAHELAENN